MKFIGMIKDRLKSISHTWIRFPVVFLLLFVMAIYASISIETNNDHTPEIYALILGVFLSAAMSFGFEKRPNSLMWLAFSQAAAVGLAVAYYFLVLGSYTGSVVDVL